MRSFFKVFFASLLALIIFGLLCVLLLIGIAGSFASKKTSEVAAHSVLLLDLSQTFHEKKVDAALGGFTGKSDVPGLFDVIRLIEHAKTDMNIAGILIKADDNGNGFASSTELRKAIDNFKSSRKFVIAQADMMSQNAYFVASAANKVYINPSGGFDWKGFSISFAFVKGLLDKLEIQPQIFYAGKFKSATEMFRTDKMTPENKLQTTVWLNSLYNYFLEQTARDRHLDTAQLHELANSGLIQTPKDALDHKLVDGLKYDDEIKEELKRNLNLDKYGKINFVTIGKYAEAVSVKSSGADKIAVIYAEGDIVDGEGSNDNIGGDHFRALIRKARLDKNVKAIVLRVNSGGGSALASDIIWRELQEAKKDKPVVVSMGDVAASGGYYIACGADSIFASPNTITGSIGVFGIIPNMQQFFKNKLGVTFDGVSTGPAADAGSITHPMTAQEKMVIQNSIERTYTQFKERVATGRKKDTAYVQEIAQGRVWSGKDALGIGLVDKMGDLDQAIACAARLAKVTRFGLREYPEPANWIDNLLNKKTAEPEAMIKEQVGPENFKIYKEMIQIRQMTQSVQARLPFAFFIH